MRFLADQDVYAATVQFLRDLGHDVSTASELGLAQAEDRYLLQAAGDQSRIFITRDRDFGGLVFVQGLGRGVVYLRLQPAALNSVHEELAKVLSSYSEGHLAKALVTVEPLRHRFRRIAP